jgi:hypothetical protein
MQFMGNYSGHFARLTCNHSYGYAHCLIFMGPIEQTVIGDRLRFILNPNVAKDRISGVMLPPLPIPFQEISQLRQN